jgi:hypothetical protein
MYEMSQRHPVWVAENHVKPCNSVRSMRRLQVGALVVSISWVKIKLILLMQFLCKISFNILL